MTGSFEGGGFVLEDAVGVGWGVVVDCGWGVGGARSLVGGGSSSSFRTSILWRLALNPVRSKFSLSEANWRLFSISLYSSEF